MIYRVTARFLQAFDALDSRAQAQALLVLHQFKTDPRMPSPDAHIINDRNFQRASYANGVWTVPFGNGYHLTYSITDDKNPDHYVCVLRNVGRQSI